MSANDIPVEIWRKGWIVFEAGEAQGAARVGEIMLGTKGEEEVGVSSGKLGDRLQATAIDAVKMRRSERRERKKVIGSPIRAAA